MDYVYNQILLPMHFCSISFFTALSLCNIPCSIQTWFHTSLYYLHISSINTFVQKPMVSFIHSLIMSLFISRHSLSVKLKIPKGAGTWPLQLFRTSLCQICDWQESTAETSVNGSSTENVCEGERVSADWLLQITSDCYFFYFSFLHIPCPLVPSFLKPSFLKPTNIICGIGKNK